MENLAELPPSMSEAELRGPATELYAAIYDIGRRHGMTFEQVLDILVRGRDLSATHRAA